MLPSETMPYVLAFAIDDLPPLPNAMRGKHWSRVRAIHNQWHWLVRDGVGRDRPPAPLDYALVTLVRHGPVRPDEDNLMASWKPVIDGLVHSRVIVDDSPAHMKLSSDWAFARRGHGYVGIGVMEIEREATPPDGRSR